MQILVFIIVALVSVAIAIPPLPAPTPSLSTRTSDCVTPGSPPCQQAYNNPQAPSSPLEMHLYPEHGCHGHNFRVISNMQLSFFYAAQLNSYYLVSFS